MSSCPSWCWEQALLHLLWLPSSPSWYCSCVAVLYTRHLYQSCVKRTQHSSDLLSFGIQAVWADRRMLEVQEGCCFGSFLSARCGSLPCVSECSCVSDHHSHMLHWLCTFIKSLRSARTTVSADHFPCSATTSDAPSADWGPPCGQAHTHQSCCMLLHRSKCFTAAYVNRQCGNVCGASGWCGHGICRRAELQLGRLHQCHGFQPHLWLPSCLVQEVSLPFTSCCTVPQVWTCFTCRCHATGLSTGLWLGNKQLSLQNQMCRVRKLQPE